MYTPRLNIWIVILAILTSTLGIAGSVTIFISLLTHKGNHAAIDTTQGTPLVENVSVTKKDLQPKEPITNALEEKALAKTIVPPPVAKIEPKKELPITKPVVETKPIKPIVAVEKPVEKKPLIVPKEPAVVAIPPKPFEKILPKETEKETPIGEEKIFDESELEQLVVRIKKARQEYGIIPNCVQISTSKTGNNKRATSQIESYLRSRKYSIAGKEMTSAKFSGIQIKEGNDCLQVLIGSF